MSMLLPFATTYKWTASFKRTPLLADGYAELWKTWLGTPYLMAAALPL